LICVVIGPKATCFFSTLLSLEAETMFIALVICEVFFVASIRFFISRNDAIPFTYSH